MGYTTNFTGQFDLDRQLTLDDYNLIRGLVDSCNDSHTEDMPDSYCQWTATKSGRGIEWDDGEKFYNYVEWLQWIIDTILKPKAYELTGQVQYQGEEIGDSGVLVIEDGKVVQKQYKPQDADIETLVRKGLEDDDEEQALYFLKLVADKMGIEY